MDNEVLLSLYQRKNKELITTKKTKDMKKSIFSKEEVIAIGKELAKNKLVEEYPHRSHSHDIFSLFPQTAAQYDWLKRLCGTTYNVIVLHTVDEVLDVVPELKGFVIPTKNGKFCRIDITL